jgi:hypothetical protein
MAVSSISGSDRQAGRYRTIGGRPVAVLASESDPAGSSEAVTPHDTNPLAGGPTRSLYVGVAGDIVVRLEDDTTDRTFKAVAVGYHPLRVTHVRATGTAATDIVALF